MNFFTTEISPWPFRSQLEGWTIDGATPPNTGQDCGETCIAMIVQWITGVRLPVDVIKDWMFDEAYTGPTAPAQIQSFLSQYCSIPTVDLSSQVTTTAGNGAGSLLNLIWQYTVKGLPLIELRQYSPTNKTLHWVADLGCDPSNVFAADPWSGARESRTYAEHSALYRGVLLGIGRTRDSML